MSRLFSWTDKQRGKCFKAEDKAEGAHTHSQFRGTMERLTLIIKTRGGPLSFSFREIFFLSITGSCWLPAPYFTDASYSL